MLILDDAGTDNLFPAPTVALLEVVYPSFFKKRDGVKRCCKLVTFNEDASVTANPCHSNCNTWG